MLAFSKILSFYGTCPKRYSVYLWLSYVYKKLNDKLYFSTIGITLLIIIYY